MSGGSWDYICFALADLSDALGKGENIYPNDTKESEEQKILQEEIIKNCKRAF